MIGFSELMNALEEQLGCYRRLAKLIGGLLCELPL